MLLFLWDIQTAPISATTHRNDPKIYNHITVEHTALEVIYKK
jgi:hypothetical protein